jgi:arabinofuranosyltransferase
LYIGGDFMSGRFFSAPYLAAVFLLIHFAETWKVQYIWIACTVFFIMGCFVPVPTLKLPTEYDMEQSVRDFESPKGILDVKARAFQTVSLIAWLRNTGDVFPDEKVTRRGIRYHENEVRVAVDGTVGVVGFFGGRQLHLIDPFALGDPLLARLPAVKDKWKIAHFPRKIPDGYFETFETGKNQIKDPNLAAYYEKLRLVISGNLWTKKRWQAIWDLNTGKYTYLLDKYLGSEN